MSNSVPWYIALTIVSLFAAICSGVVLAYLKSIKSDFAKYADRLDRHDERIDAIAEKLANCRTTRKTETVDKEDWVRSEGYTRRELKDLAMVLARMEGKLAVVEQLPAICGQIAREIAQQMQKQDTKSEKSHE